MNKKTHQTHPGKIPKVKRLKAHKPPSRNKSYLQGEKVCLTLSYYLISNGLKQPEKRKKELQPKNPIIS